MTPADTVFAYHEQTKHHYHRYARSAGHLDWENQPDPFRRFEGAPRFLLPFADTDPTCPYEELYADASDPKPLTLEMISTFFENALAVSASKAYAGSSWKLRVNPSSGNLHPTEAYLVAPPVEGLSDRAGVYHYGADDHALEQRCAFSASTWDALSATLPAESFLVGLTSIFWREAWKYGERAYRYCQHDVGHALAALSFSAAALGWRAAQIDDLSEHAIAMLLGLDREPDFSDSEPEFPELVVAVMTRREDSSSRPVLRADAVREVSRHPWKGCANRLSADRVPWDIIDHVATAAAKPETQSPAPDPTLPDRSETAFGHACAASARRIVQQRRSAVAMDGVTPVSKRAFLTMLDRTLPQPGRTPWHTWPQETRIHLALFIHRVEGVPQGLYMLVRDPMQCERLQNAMKTEFDWEQPEACPEELPLYRLAAGDYRGIAAQVSCTQEIAGHSAFSLGMIADFHTPITRHGAWVYPRLFWEAGIVGQVLYLEAEAAGIRSTGIGCYFDDPVHDLLGLHDRAFQSFYHFTVGGAVEDSRITGNPPYDEDRRAQSGWV